MAEGDANRMGPESRGLEAMIPLRDAALDDAASAWAAGQAEAITREPDLYVAMAPHLQDMVGAPHEAGMRFNEAALVKKPNGWYEFRVTFKPDAHHVPGGGV